MAGSNIVPRAKQLVTSKVFMMSSLKMEDFNVKQHANKFCALLHIDSGGCLTEIAISILGMQRAGGKISIC
jgi:hypothetical protein